MPLKHSVAAVPQVRYTSTAAMTYAPFVNLSLDQQKAGEYLPSLVIYDYKLQHLQNNHASSVLSSFQLAAKKLHVISLFYHC